MKSIMQADGKIIRMRRSFESPGTNHFKSRHSVTVSLSLIAFFILLSLITTTATADLITYYFVAPSGAFSALTFLSIVILNFPVNAAIYMLLLIGICFLKKDYILTKTNPLLSFPNLLSTIFFATLLGAIVDFKLVIPLYHSDSAKVAFSMFIALILIFLIFFLLCIFVQGFEWKDAVKVGTVFLVLNLVAWVIQLGMARECKWLDVPHSVVIVFYVAFLLVMIIFVWWYLKHRKAFLGALQKTPLRTKIRTAIACIICVALLLPMTVAYQEARDHINYFPAHIYGSVEKHKDNWTITISDVRNPSGVSIGGTDISFLVFTVYNGSSKIFETNSAVWDINESGPLNGEVVTEYPYITIYREGNYSIYIYHIGEWSLARTLLVSDIIYLAGPGSLSAGFIFKIISSNYSAIPNEVLFETVLP